MKPLTYFGVPIVSDLSEIVVAVRASLRRHLLASTVIMSTDGALVPLRKTLTALREIRSALIPYLKLLKRSSTTSSSRKSGVLSSSGGGSDDAVIDPHRLAEARTAVALAAGTLRYMAARLRGNGVEGRKKDDPLRMELDKTRKMLVTLRGLERKKAGGGAASSNATGGTAGAGTSKPQAAAAQDPPQATSSSKVGKVLDVSASQRMVKAALSGPPSVPTVGEEEEMSGDGVATKEQVSSPPRDVNGGGGGGSGKRKKSRSRSRSPVRGDRDSGNGGGKKKKNKKQRE